MVKAPFVLTKPAMLSFVLLQTLHLISWVSISIRYISMFCWKGLWLAQPSMWPQLKQTHRLGLCIHWLRDQRNYNDQYMGNQWMQRTYQYHISIISAYGESCWRNHFWFTSPWDAARFFGYGSPDWILPKWGTMMTVQSNPFKKTTTDVHPNCNKQWIIAFPTFSQVCWFRYPQLGGNGRLSHSAWGCSVARSRCWRHCAKSTELNWW